MSTFEVWVSPEHAKLLEEIYNVGKAPDADPYGPRVTRGDGRVLISFETNEYEEAALDAVWEHRGMFGWETREDMKLALLLMGVKRFVQ